MSRVTFGYTFFHVATRKIRSIRGLRRTRDLMGMSFKAGRLTSDPES